MAILAAFVIGLQAGGSSRKRGSRPRSTLLRLLLRGWALGRLHRGGLGVYEPLHCNPRRI